MCVPSASCPWLVRGPITHFGQAGITACARVPDGTDVQRVHLLGKPDTKVGQRLQGESWEPPSSPPRPKNNHPLLSPQQQPLFLAFPVQQAVEEVSQQLGPTPMEGGGGRGLGQGPKT